VLVADADTCLTWKTRVTAREASPEEIECWSPTQLTANGKGDGRSCRRSPGRPTGGIGNRGFDPWPAATAEAMSPAVLWVPWAAAIAPGAERGQSEGPAPLWLTGGRWRACPLTHKTKELGPGLEWHLEALAGRRLVALKP